MIDKLKIVFYIPPKLNLHVFKHYPVIQFQNLTSRSSPLLQKILKYDLDSAKHQIFFE